METAHRAFFLILSAQRLHSGYHFNFFYGHRTLEKTVKTVILSAFLEVWPLPDKVFLQVFHSFYFFVFY